MGNSTRRVESTLAELFIAVFMLLGLTWLYAYAWPRGWPPAARLLGFYLIEAAVIARLWALRPVSLAQPGNMKRFGIAVGAGFVFVCAALFAAWSLDPDMARQEKVLVYWLSPASRAVYFITLVVIAPVIEEMLYRGQVFSILRSNYGITVGVLGSTLLFAIMHGLAPVAFVQGLLLVFVYEYSGSLWGSISLHAANNAIWYMVFVK